MNLAVNNTSLFLAAMLVLVALGISLWQKLGLDRDIVIGVVRAVVQLFIVGYLLKYIFRVNNLWLTLAMIGFIIFNAAWNAKKRGPGIDHALAISLLAIFVSTGVTLGVLVLSGAIKFVPSQMIPISGMIASNSMVAIGLAYRSLNSQFHDQRQGVLERLALGAGLLDASIAIVREAIRTGMSPTIDSAKTVGLVSLPGMMTGQILGGSSPLDAVHYQILIMFLITAGTGFGSIAAVRSKATVS